MATKKIYLDNAASTPMDPRVIETVWESMKENFGNPSASHSFGQTSKSKIEIARKIIAKELNAQPSEIIFTSCGTEANNLILRSCIENLAIQRIITTKIEHKSVGETVKYLKNKHDLDIVYLPVNNKGEWQLSDLENLLQDGTPTLVTLMHANNEIGNLIDLKSVANLCKKYNAWFHSDTVQSMGHYSMNFSDVPIDFASCSAHKFHGPQGIGFAYIRKSTGIKAIQTGGGQERGMRSGTENIAGIVGLGKAFQLAMIELEERKKIIEELKLYAITQLKKYIPNIKFNGKSDDLNQSIYTLISILLPFSNSMIGFQLDMKGIAVSQGSACSSGAVSPSSTIQELLTVEELSSCSILRISFSHFNTKEDIEHLVMALKNIYEQDKSNARVHKS
ncbi:cysteine desulfurase [Apibacter muscae]|uniref:cysteine desulfurase n=1 Tax=Apibacter muscae TaxID=2509004 RepID=A0A563DER9_9FLAO|nr:cysteine desulfurase family protein [Apibacter muscae]TWP28788.1 cysteine desulfurase [Apibacter muscae]